MYQDDALHILFFRFIEHGLPALPLTYIRTTNKFSILKKKIVLSLEHLCTNPTLALEIKEKLFFIVLVKL